MANITRRSALQSIAVAGTGLAVGAAGASAQDGQMMAKPAAPGMKVPAYAPVVYKLDDLVGLNKDMLEQHYKLYAGYVTNTNKANTALSEMIAAGKTDSADFAETRRRLGFEYNGMRLHEYYFGSMKSGGSPVDAKLKAAVEAVWGTWDAWMADFVRTGMMRGIGWSMLYQDPMNGALSHHWISDHEYFHPAGFTPILVMDVWEHAYYLQFGAQGRKAYVDAFFKNVDWSVVGKRLK